MNQPREVSFPRLFFSSQERKFSCYYACAVLLTETELSYDCAVTLDVAILQVVQKATTAADNLLQRVVRCSIFLVELHVLSEVVDTEREQCYLAFS